jgi:glycosyltransferase involved in cell wall biosynthesis
MHYLLVDAESFPTGGLVAFTAHVAGTLAAAGHQVDVIRLGETTQRRPKTLGFGLSYYLMTPRDVLAAAAHCPTFLTCVYWPQYAELVDPLLRAGLPLTLHDQRDGSLYVKYLAGRAPGPGLARREAMQGWLAARGIASAVCGLPYIRAAAPAESPHRSAYAACVARIGYEKGIETMLQANALLPPPQQVYLYGSGASSLYGFRTLTAKYPTWKRRWYRGPFPRYLDAAVVLLRQARWAVDLSQLDGFGGGSQYTFLEAWDAGAGNVVHRGWLRPEDTMVDGVNCRAVDGPAELAAVLAAPGPVDPGLLAAGRALVAAHGPAAMAPRLLAALDACRPAPAATRSS